MLQLCTSHKHTSVSPWLFAGTSASASLATSAAVRLETAPTPVRDVARMRWTCLFCCICCVFLPKYWRVWSLHQEIQSYTFIGSLREGQVWSRLLPVCWKFHRRGLWIKVRVCLHCWRWGFQSIENCLQYKFSSSGITGAVIFVILLVLLIWMICVRATRVKKPEKHGLGKTNNQQQWNSSQLILQDLEPRVHMVRMEWTSTTEPQPPMLRALPPAITAPMLTTTTMKRTDGTCLTSTTRYVQQHVLNHTEVVFRQISSDNIYSRVTWSKGWQEQKRDIAWAEAREACTGTRRSSTTGSRGTPTSLARARRVSDSVYEKQSSLMLLHITHPPFFRQEQCKWDNKWFWRCSPVKRIHVRRLSGVSVVARMLHRCL